MRGISALVVVVVTATLPVWGQTTAEGLEAFRGGQYGEAKRVLETVVQAHPEDEAARTGLALSQAASGGCAEATAELSRQLEGNGDATLRRLAGLALAQCYAAEAKPELWGLLDRLGKAFPGDPDVLYQTAKAHMKAWNDTVFAMYEKAPASYRVNQLSGEILEIQGQYGEAASEYRKAIEKNPAAMNLHFRLGRALLLQSHDPANLEAARKEFEAELKLNPSDAVAEYQVGQILTAQQKAGEAAGRYAKAVELNPEFAEALVALGKAKSQGREYGEAIPLLERAVKLQPRNETALYSLMLAYRNAGRGEDAERTKAALDKLTQPEKGEFAQFLEKLGEKAPQQ